ncbi:MAG: hypothetical protein CBC03_14480 [Pseudoalteromonas sp. TMED43]|nr:MAG: hypothetical protein CBC03_14480 [Pseudoalteromonas sp. TMED43]|tara:strand:- start:1190 stop:1699 length:510 start_codon:yes stop_codon:yes gene_type:complete
MKKILIVAAVCTVLLGCGQKEEKRNAVPVAVAPTPPPVAFVGSQFTRPYKYHGFDVAKVSEILGVKPNAAGNIEVETNEHLIRYDVTDGVISYSEVYMLETAPCNQSQSFDPIVMLDAVAVNLADLEMNTRMTHLATYYDHQEKLKISVTCEQDGTPIVVRFSNKYYGY